MLFIAPMSTWGPDVCLSVCTRGFADFTDVTLADEETNTDDANRAIPGNMAMQSMTSGGQICN